MQTITQERKAHNKQKQKVRTVLKEKKWESKVMHGQYIRRIDKKLISEEDTFLWLSKGELKVK
jgi:hypothetical protein